MNREFETILINLLEYSTLPVVEISIREFLHDCNILREEFWSEFRECNSFDDVFNMYYQYSKNKCKLVDLLWDDLSFALDYYPLRTK